jgi:hypothetical protein
MSTIKKWGAHTKMLASRLSFDKTLGYTPDIQWERRIQFKGKPTSKVSSENVPVEKSEQKYKPRG